MKKRPWVLVERAGSDGGGCPVRPCVPEGRAGSDEMAWCGGVRVAAGEDGEGGKGGEGDGVPERRKRRDAPDCCCCPGNAVRNWSDTTCRS